MGSPVSDQALVAAAGIGCGASALFFGFYNVSLWGPIALVTFVVVLALSLARQAPCSGPALLALLGLAGLAAWSLLSTTWAESADQALTEANRWLFYTALFGAMVLLLQDAQVARLLIACTTLAVLGVTLYIVATMLLGHGSSLFFANRLHEPMGYINGLAGYLMLGFWPLAALAERARPRTLAAAGMSGAMLLAGILMLTQTRAVVLSFAVAALVLLALFEGRRRRLWAFLLVAGGVLVLSGPLTDVMAVANVGDPPTAEAAIARAAAFTLVVAVAAGLLWWAAGTATASLLERGRGAAELATRISTGVLASIAVVAVVTTTRAIGDPVQALKGQVDAFLSLSPTEQGSRFLYAGGNRYDYWRIALGAVDQNPAVGIGGGNYDAIYFSQRRTEEHNVRQPHSLELQVLTELGVVGAIPLALFLAGVFGSLAQAAKRSRAPPGDRALSIAAAGMFTGWLVHTSVDWLHLLPGVTGIALFAAAVLVMPGPAGAAPAPRVLAAGAAIKGLVAALALVGAVTVGRHALAERLLVEGQDSLRDNPAKALERANASLEWNDESLPSYYLRAAAYARFDRYADARGTLEEATRREPHDFVAWALLGDLALRRGDLGQARSAYARASELNPRDTSLLQLAREPSPAPRP